MADKIIVKDTNFTRKDLDLLVSTGELLIVEELTNDKIDAFKSQKSLYLLKDNKCISITVTEEALGKADYDYTFINKIKIITMPNGKKNAILYVSYSTNPDFRKSFSENPIKFMKTLNGYPIYDTTMTCINITDIINDYL